MKPEIAISNVNRGTKTNIHGRPSDLDYSKQYLEKFRPTISKNYNS